jgi:hypothetical protein
VGVCYLGPHGHNPKGGVNVTRFFLNMVFGALLAAAVLFAPPAHASGHYVRTLVSWEGAPCIDVTYSDPTSSYTFTRAVCGGSYTRTESNVWGGDWIGVDPIMGSASFIACDMWIDGVLSWTDSAYAGDGSDVNCLRVKL